MAQAKGTNADNAVRAVDILEELGGSTIDPIYYKQCFYAIREAALDPRPAVRQAAERALARSRDFW